MAGLSVPIPSDRGLWPGAADQHSWRQDRVLPGPLLPEKGGDEELVTITCANMAPTQAHGALGRCSDQFSAYWTSMPFLEVQL